MGVLGCQPADLLGRLLVQGCICIEHAVIAAAAFLDAGDKAIKK
ncbi:hypothetical protein [Pseudomonas chlororaphis]|nr:hypothetical protein [Pseudomonas chlororaphis]WDG52441.1 hypothetical protein PUP76_21580 [Pseudomonas chlororaphis]WDH86542.1 hypothetical protein PUP74_20605 [Pseudomonas chlororaphis]